MSLDDAKAAARHAAFARRKRAHAGASRRQSDLLVKAIEPHLGKAISGYNPIRTEIDPTPAMALAAARGIAALPVIVSPGAPLVFHRWTPDATLVDGPFGARVPASADPVIPDVVIVPLVAFDRQGNRLGYGGGFYDRTLEHLRAARPVLAIGFAFSAQETDELPREPTDQPLDMVVTDREIIVPGQY